MGSGQVYTRMHTFGCRDRDQRDQVLECSNTLQSQTAAKDKAATRYTQSDACKRPRVGVGEMLQYNTH